MSYQDLEGIRVWGVPDESAVRQMRTCAQTGDVFQAALMADHHKGYSQPIGGVVAYHDMVSPSGVGYDIACGNKAVRTNLHLKDIRKDLHRILDEIQKQVAFGLGRTSNKRIDHELFDDESWKEVKPLKGLYDLARSQLGTVGSGNHYVDILQDVASGEIWVAVHFGSRGFGHKTATGFLNLAAGRAFDAKPPGESMDQPPALFSVRSQLGQDYLRAMSLAGRYAYAGRDAVIQQVLDLLGADDTFSVHNHHNYAWKEEHNGQEVYVVRKGATPCFPGQLGFIGGSMADISVVVRGKDSAESALALYSTVHGAGRIMSRTQAAGKMNWKKKRRIGGSITREQMLRARIDGVELRGAGTDESPFVYRKLEDVLDAHKATLDILHVLKPVGVVMAGEDEYDPYMD
ncbi:MAG: RNA-splicing ligase RtcB [Candidatus Hinthialibacteria bacterium OLB16]|nr:MAG: RNA-splicing ligase RtcB [Candidatus Hinthialibacteria bacterium OLB16]